MPAAHRLGHCVFAVDFDGTCVSHAYPRVGCSIGAESVLRRIARNGGKIILWTMRTGDPLDEAVKWFQQKETEMRRQLRAGEKAGEG